MSDEPDASSGRCKRFIGPSAGRIACVDADGAIRRFATRRSRAHRADPGLALGHRRGASRARRLRPGEHRVAVTFGDAVGVGIADLEHEAGPVRDPARALAAIAAGEAPALRLCGDGMPDPAWARARLAQATVPVAQALACLIETHAHRGDATARAPIVDAAAGTGLADARDRLAAFDSAAAIAAANR